MLETFLSVLIALFLLVNPIGLVPVFISLTAGTPISYKNKMAIKGCFISWCILLLFALIGDDVLSALGISVEAFRVGGGMLLAITGFRMVLEQRQERNSEKAKEHHPVEIEANQDTKVLEDVSVFPIATLFIAGPGAITVMMLMMHQYGSEIYGKVMILLALTINIIILCLLFVLSGKIERYLPETITSVFGRVIGMLIVALSVQFIFDGITDTFLK